MKKTGGRKSRDTLPLRRSGEHIFVDLSLFVLLNTNFMNKLFFKAENKNNSLTVQIFFNLQITPLFTQRKGWSIYSERKRVLCSSIIIIYMYTVQYY